MNNNRTKVITIAALVIVIIALSIGFAAFSSTLNIQTGASVTPTDTFSVKFASGVTGSNGEFTEFQVTPTTPVYKVASGDATPGTPEIDNTDIKNPSIGNLSAAFTAPGQSVTYTFYVVNDGNYDAYLTNLVFNNATGASSFKDCVSDSLSSNPATQSLVDNVCSNISFTMSIGNESNIQSSRTLTNHLLTRNHYETVIVTISYTGSAYADGAFKVNFGDIDLNYRTIDEVEATQDTPATSEEQNYIYVGDLVPTEEQISLISQEYYEHDDKENIDFYYFAISETSENMIYYQIDDSGKYVILVYNNQYFMWPCDESAIQSLNEGYDTNNETSKWYYSSDGETFEVYNGSSPFSLTDFDASEINSVDYVKRVIASFNS